MPPTVVSRRSSPVPTRIARLMLMFMLAVSIGMLASPAAAKPKVHTVYSGQRLGSIAKRYNVTVDELCEANGISRRDPIHPGQKLIIPGTDDGTGGKEKDEPSKPDGKARIHVVAKGHTLSAIAGRYAITVGALCHANDISRQATLTVGQKLVIPHKSDEGGRYARKQLERGHFDDELDEGHSSKASETPGAKEDSWEPYVKPAWRRGYIKIRRYGRYWEGYVIGPENQVLGHASNKINFVLGAKEDGPRIDSKLVRLIASISDKFGGREMRIVSGYRTKSFVAASKHKEGKALDFSIPGVPNEALRDYLRTIDGVGVGYYPNSSFVHIDVRGYNSYWIDYAGPGEAPRKAPRSSKKAPSKAPSSKAASDDAEEEDESEESDGAAEDDADGTPEGDPDDSPSSSKSSDSEDSASSKDG